MHNCQSFHPFVGMSLIAFLLHLTCFWYLLLTTSPDFSPPQVLQRAHRSDSGWIPFHDVFLPDPPKFCLGLNVTPEVSIQHPYCTQEQNGTHTHASVHFFTLMAPDGL